MRTLTITVMGLSLAACLHVAAQQVNSDKKEPPRKQQEKGETQNLTAAQQQKIKTILAEYDSEKLTAADAKAINNAFREAEIRNGPGLQEAIIAAGFVPEKISVLDPPPDRPGNEQSSTNNQKPD